MKALVTGGRSGIGAALVELLDDEGYDVQVLDVADGFDVSDARAWEAVGPVELACLNAGVTGEGDVTRVTDDDYRRVVAVNVDGVVFGVRRLARVMEPGAAIVVTASLAGLTTIEVNPVYGGTKHFVVGFVRSAAKQLSERGITINAVCPALVDTPMIAAIREETLARGIAMLQPEEVAVAIVHAARSGETGRAWPVLPGRRLEPHDFPTFFRSA